MIIDHKNKTVIVTIPKVGTSSIKALYPHLVDCNFRREKQTAPKGYKTIAFIRHPWERIVSAFTYPLTTEGDPNYYMERYWSFDIANSHVRPQSTFIDAQPVDRLVHLDNIRSIFPEVAHYNKTSDKPGWKSYPIDWDFWYPRYERDFELCREALS